MHKDVDVEYLLYFHIGVYIETRGCYTLLSRNVCAPALRILLSNALKLIDINIDYCG